MLLGPLEHSAAAAAVDLVKSQKQNEMPALHQTLLPGPAAGSLVVCRIRRAQTAIRYTEPVIAILGDTQLTSTADV